VGLVNEMVVGGSKVSDVATSNSACVQCMESAEHRGHIEY